MKTLVAKNTGWIIGLASAALALTAPTAPAAIIPVSPIGQWDCILSGPGQNAILFLNFTDDRDTNSGFPTFEGYFVQAGHQTRTPAGRGGFSTNSIENLFGGGFIEGSSGGVAENGGPDDWLSDSRGHRGTWFYNNKGQIVGSFFTTLNVTTTVTNFFESCYITNFSIALTNGGSLPFSFTNCATNAILTTNVPWGPASDGEFGTTNLTFVNTNFTLGSIGVTNNVSFVGKVVLGKRLTMTGTSTFGQFTIRGVPLQPIQTVSGVPVDDGFFWTGTKVENGTHFAEVFNLTPTVIFNVYGMTGQGPSYSYGPTNSACMISVHKKIGFAVSEVSFNGNADRQHVSRASIGSFINTRKTIGTQSVGDSVNSVDLIQFNAYLTPFIP